MPLYAYIKIPGIQNSESTDETYGKAWIPIRKFDLKGGSNEGMNATHAKTWAEAFSRQRAERREELETFNVTGFGELFDPEAESEEVESEVTRRAKIREERAARRKAATKEMDLNLDELFEEKEDREKSEGEISFEKMIDSASPKLQLLCLTCGLYDSTKYIKGKVEVHICRQIPGGGGGPDDKEVSKNEVYMAYVLEDCLITSVAVDASESSKLQETVTISYEKISSCIKTDKGTWDSKGWDFIEEKEVGPATPCNP
jgi:type VI protein secretion system component Hcp